MLKNIDRKYESKICYQTKTDIFRLFTLIEPKNIKVVIIGKDPYPYHESSKRICDISQS
ncbi:hypothetical protein [Spiroplasma endosymbiont of Polydrusus formosus]|uniref:hypothetical protein n=1 Tax=Spiroplasma endosymbiont of Polydrusus formosus TaxID=3139326 RepID=UPI0035B4FE06